MANLSEKIRPSSEIIDGDLDNGLKDSAELDNEEDNFSESYWLSLEQKTLLAFAITILYGGLWISWGIFNKDFWTTTIKVSEYLSNIYGFLLAYSWFFSEIAYKWYMFIIGILIAFAPRKDRAWTSIATFITSYVVRQYIRLLAEESRPQYDSIIIKIWHCNCSFGLPSGHSEGSTMLYTLLIYNFMPQKPTTNQRILYSILCFWICTSVYFSRVYFGKHSIMQVLLGGTQGYFFFFWMLRFENQLNEFFRGFLNGCQKTIKIVIGVSAAVAILSSIAWYAYFDVRISDLNIPHLTCAYCFTNKNEYLRHDLGRALTFPFIVLALAVAQAMARPAYKVRPEHVRAYVPRLTSINGIKRLFSILICYSPLILTLFVKVNPHFLVLLSCLLNVVSGYAIGSQTLIYDKLEWTIQGDASSLSSLNTVEKLKKDTEMY